MNDSLLAFLNLLPQCLRSVLYLFHFKLNFVEGNATQRIKVGINKPSFGQSHCLPGTGLAQRQLRAWMFSAANPNVTQELTSCVPSCKTQS